MENPDEIPDGLRALFQHLGIDPADVVSLSAAAIGGSSFPGPAEGLVTDSQRAMVAGDWWFRFPSNGESPTKLACGFVMDEDYARSEFDDYDERMAQFWRPVVYWSPAVGSDSAVGWMALDDMTPMPEALSQTAQEYIKSCSSGTVPKPPVELLKLRDASMAESIAAHKAMAEANPGSHEHCVHAPRPCVNCGSFAVTATFAQVVQFRGIPMEMHDKIEVQVTERRQSPMTGFPFDSINKVMQIHCSVCHHTEGIDTSNVEIEGLLG